MIPQGTASLSSTAPAATVGSSWKKSHEEKWNSSPISTGRSGSVPTVAPGRAGDALSSSLKASAARSVLDDPTRTGYPYESSPSYYGRASSMTDGYTPSYPGRRTTGSAIVAASLYSGTGAPLAPRDAYHTDAVAAPYAASALTTPFAKPVPGYVSSSRPAPAPASSLLSAAFAASPASDSDDAEDTRVISRRPVGSAGVRGSRVPISSDSDSSAEEPVPARPSRRSSAERLTRGSFTC